MKYRSTTPHPQQIYIHIYIYTSSSVKIFFKAPQGNSIASNVARALI